MRIAQVNNITGKSILKLVKKNLINNVYRYIDTPSMKSILKDYSIEDIEDAVSYIHISYGYIVSPVSVDYNRIIRLLQFGGPGVKALNLISLSIVGLEGGDL